MKNNTLELYFENTSKGYRAKELLECLYEDEPMKICFNINFLKSVLSVLESDIEWYLHHVKHPTLFVEENTCVSLMAVKVEY